MSSGVRLARSLLALLILVVGLHGPAHTASTVLVVTSGHGGAYDETIAGLRYGLRGTLPEGGLSIIDPEALVATPLSGARLIIAIGSRAALAAREHAPHIPVLNTLLPRATYEQLYREGIARPNSAIFLDQPVGRQIAALAESLPGWRLAMIAGPRSEDLVSQLSEAARARDIAVITASIDSEHELYSAMQTILADRAVLLGIPDHDVFNSHTIQNILLTSYRQRSPLMGFSPAYVRAGALLALYSTPAQIGEQTADAVRSLLMDKGLPAPGYPIRFKVGINTTVARSLGITMESEDAITARLMLREGIQ